ncbi:hypothetical protein GGH19_002088 [Coemansia sp. RSA 1807]|nr:hypothetical protein LPJ58_000009 [Coemansia sp. RSA 1591]KAJ1765051.1 hypothetical protein LPJ54_005406 [Coemansia sp. RSA 1824]KAJ1768250.1 hypothetical protein LPJ69_000133 [Coemansia sp. RSA 1752]KAJ1791755.1 hypothetical protein LPJ62_001215 [Coemansia sp. RSA 2167]KAJ1795390.1 hypothetical protein LPJ67_000009 [Coemansia sp. RSA 1938]KAJ2133108.1 hypothetical protein GGF48_000402 [Coemansia sp. RSA 921]KAJ2146050.1 hypothetical protein IW142_002285 [Coemansia sp. RSA 564]KAJ2153773.
MSSLPDDIKLKAEAEFPGCQVFLDDISGGCGAMYRVTLVWDGFEGMNRLKKHQRVNAAFKAEIAKMHAFEQKTFTKAQYEEELAKTATNPEETQ